MNPQTFRIACTLALLAVVPGCSSTALRPKTMAPELLARSSVGQHQFQLRGMSSLGERSTTIGPDDSLNVRLLTGLSDQDEEPLRVRVADDGTIKIPYVGLVQVAGVEPSAAADLIANTAVQRGVYRQPQVNVAVAKQAVNRVTILGAVAEPGVHEVPRSACDILTSIASAGGFSEEAGTVVEVLRHGHGVGQFASADAQSDSAEASAVKQVVFDSPPLATPRTETFDLAASDPNTIASQQLADRDVIVVRPKEKRFVHVSGLVHKPDQFELPDQSDVRLLDAIAMAGGTTTPVADKVLVIRQATNRSEPVMIQVSMSEAKKSGVDNVLLQAGDLVSVEATVATTVVETFKDLFRITMGVGGNLTLF